MGGRLAQAPARLRPSRAAAIEGDGDGPALGHQPPLVSQSSIIGRRSQPQKGSPSTKNQGEPKTPRPTASSDRALASALISGSETASAVRPESSSTTARSPTSRPA